MVPSGSRFAMPSSSVGTRVGEGIARRRLPRYTPRASGHRAPCSDSGSAPLSRGYALTPPVRDTLASSGRS